MVVCMRTRLDTNRSAQPKRVSTRERFTDASELLETNQIGTR